MTAIRPSDFNGADFNCPVCGMGLTVEENENAYNGKQDEVICPNCYHSLRVSAWIQYSAQAMSNEQMPLLGSGSNLGHLSCPKCGRWSIVPYQWAYFAGQTYRAACPWCSHPMSVDVKPTDSGLGYVVGKS